MCCTRRMKENREINCCANAGKQEQNDRESLRLPVLKCMIKQRVSSCVRC